jgi:hypothetical protein
VPSKRLLAFSAGIAAIAALLVWQPWKPAPRRQWTAGPAVPTARTTEERQWLGRLGGWIAFVRRATDDPTHQAILSCRSRLSGIGAAPDRLRDVRALASDACEAFRAESRDSVSAYRSVDAKLEGKAMVEGREANRDMTALVSSIALRAPPGGWSAPGCPVAAERWRDLHSRPVPCKQTPAEKLAAS